MNNVEKILRIAQAILQEPEAWTQGQAATNETGVEVDPQDYDAVKFCIIGAMERAHMYLYESGLSYQDEIEAREALIDIFKSDPFGAETTPEWNDWPSRKQEDVLRLFDKAIKGVEEKAK